MSGDGSFPDTSFPTVDELDALGLLDRPTTPWVGMRALALWFDVKDAKDGRVGQTDVQDDLRRWADEVERDFTDAARLRSLVARMDSHLNRGRSFTGAEVAAMLRDGGPADDSDIMPGSEFDGPVVL